MTSKGIPISYEEHDTVTKLQAKVYIVGWHTDGKVRAPLQEIRTGGNPSS